MANNEWEGYSPISNGYFNENYGSYQSSNTGGGYCSPPPSSSYNYANSWNSTNSWNSSPSLQQQPIASASPSEGFGLLNLVDNCYTQAVEEKKQGIKPDYSECPWLKNPEGKRGRPAEYSSEERKWAKWRNNWIYTEKQEMSKEIQKAERFSVQKTNAELKDEYFQLCLEAIVLSENLCPHNRSTVSAAMENPNVEKRICACGQNGQNGQNQSRSQGWF